MLKSDRKKITFILPTLSYLPSGGFKIVYEYANRFLKMGHEICLIHPNVVENETRGRVFKSSIRNLKFIKRSFSKKQYTGSWFPIDKGVKNRFVPEISNRYIPDSDVVIATGWQTAGPVLELLPQKGKKFYFIQGLETWCGSEEEIFHTWKYPFHKIVISKWLQKLVESRNEFAYHIPNGLDFEKFNIDVYPEQKKSNTVLMIISNNDVKGSEYGIRSLYRLKELKPEIEVTLFGAENYKTALPDWMRFCCNPSQPEIRKLYNSSSIFISHSLMEGFSLPPAEAMMCGCAVVSSDTGGLKEYGEGGKNCLIFTPKDVDKCVELTLWLMENEQLRYSIAHQGNKDIQKFKWENSVKKFIDLITKHI